MDFLYLSYISQFMKLILCPANILNLEVKENEFLLFGAFLCNQIWKYRNKVVFKGRSSCFVEIKSSLEKDLIEHTSLRQQVASEERSELLRSVVNWTKLARGTIKINVDVVVGRSYSVLAVVAKDQRGDLIFACSNKVNTNSPLQAEVEALRWTVSLADQMNSSTITFEGDCQICLNTVSKHCQEVSWRIKTITLETIVALESLPNPTVCWVPRKANMAAPNKKVLS